MNDDTDKPLNTVGDDALEARITAWVLGEASSFEAGELEKLCAADPALRLFERRLRVLHGLVAEDFKAGPDVAWKLSAGRRAKITDLLGVEPVVEEVLPRRKSRRGSSVRGLILALAACVVIGVASFAMLGGVGQRADLSMVKESPRIVSYSAEVPGEAAEARYSLHERKAAAPARKPDSAYAHLGTNSPFTSKPPPAARAASQRGASAGGRPVPVEGESDLLADRNGRDQDAAALAANEPQPEIMAKRMEATRGTAELPAEAAPEIASRTNTDFIPPPVGAAIPGGAAAPGSTVSPLTAGTRSGDAAITRNSIDAVLNHPERAVVAKQKGEGIAGLTGTFSDEGIAQVEKKSAERPKPAAPAGTAMVERKDDGASELTGRFRSESAVTDGKVMEAGSGEGRIAGANGKAGAVEPEGLARGPETGKSVAWLVSGEADEAGLGGGGGMPQEPQAGIFFNMNTTSESPWKSNLRLGSERDLEQGDATTFADLDEMGRLAGEAKPQLDVDYYDSNSDRQVVDGIADLSDLARKQSEAGVDAQNPGHGFGGAVPAGGDPATGGLKRDLSLEPVPAGAPAAPAPAATGDFDGFVNYGAPIPSEIADESQKARLRGITEMDAGDVTIEALAMSKKLEIAPEPTEDEVRAQLLEEVDRAWDLSVSAGDSLALTDPESAAPAKGKANAVPPATASEDPIRGNPAIALEDAGKIDEVRRKLYIAEGNQNLGKLEDAQKTYEEVLRIDPYNEAARRGMEKVAAAKSDYYRAAYDQTRADVDGAIELTVPPIVQPGNEPPSAASDKVNELTALLDFDKNIPVPNSGTYSGLAQKEMLRRQNAVAQSDKIRDEGRTAYAAGNYAEAYRKLVASLHLLPDAPILEDRRDYIQMVLQDAAKALSVTAERVGEKELAAKWMEKSGEWALKKAAPAEPVVVEPTAETLAADEPFSTFSLHVSDASFKLAHAAMERGEVPAAEGIRPEEFYNAFDYGDPAPAAGEPVVCVTEQSAHPAFAQRNLLRIGVRTGSQGRGQSTPLNLTLLLDHSGSMEREDRNAGLAMAVRQLSSLLKEGDTITVAGFSRQPRLLADRLPGARAQELNELIARTPSEGGTNLEEGLKLAEELAKRQFNPAAQNRVVLFTDGAANLGDARPEALQARIEALRQQGIAFDAAGFGADGLNDKLLERLTRNGNGRYYVVDGPEDADAGFAKQLAGAFRPAAENVKVQVRFNPARVAKYKLIGFEEHRLQKEDFRNDAVDAAEMAAEEAGNALYQIETLPQGEGEVGEVSVRFRDVASGQMVERTWTIPYDAQAPAFDRATPSIQLAGLAAFAAEKLRAAPMADAVDFQQLGQVFAGVRARYPNSQPVADLGSMIGKMK